jgi:hypothetical protein
MDAAAFERGIELLSRLYGDSYREVLDRLRDIAPDFGRYIVEFIAGGNGQALAALVDRKASFEPIPGRCPSSGG